MGTVRSKGISYFNIECVQEDKLEFIQAKHKIEGYGLLLRLWQKIYSIEGYFCEWKEKNIYLFAKDNGVSVEFLNDLVNTCFEEEIFSLEKFERYSVLTSRGVQKRWLRVVTDAKRKDREIDEKYNLIDETPEYKTKTPAEIEKTLVVDIQRKKESKVNKEKRESIERKRDFIPPTPAQVFEFFKEKIIESKWSEKKCKSEADKFVGRYAGVGWVVGNSKTKMTDWKGVASKWILTDSEFNSSEKKTENNVHTSAHKVKKAPEDMSAEISEQEKKARSIKAVTDAWKNFKKNSYFEDFGNTIYNSLIRLNVNEFIQFIAGKDEYYLEKGFNKLRCKSEQKQGEKLNLMAVFEANQQIQQRSGQNERSIVEGKKEAVLDFFKEVEELWLDLEQLIQQS